MEKNPGADASERPELTGLVRAIVSCSHRLAALGAAAGAVGARGGTWGFMKSLDDGGPQTIPELAAARPVSRQHIQKLASELQARGWLTTRPNPRHKRSFLLDLTPAGRRQLRALDRTIQQTLRAHLGDVPSGELRQTLRTLETVAARLANALEESTAGPGRPGPPRSD